MDTFITLVLPNPIFVPSGQSRMLIVDVTAAVPVEGAKLRFTNTVPAAAQLLDWDEAADQVHSPPVTLNAGLNQVSHTLGFHLEAPAETGGAIIGLTIEVVDSAGTALSPPSTLLATIAATG